MDIEKIYRIYFADVYRFLLYLCKNEAIAQDICSETFIRAIGNIEKIEDESIKTYLFQIAKNTYYNYYKKNKRLVFSDKIEDFDRAYGSFEKDLIENEAIAGLRRAIESLDEPARSIVKLRLAEVSYKEIAKIYKKSENRACVVYYRAKEKLKEMMED